MNKGGKLFLSILVILMLGLSGCSLFVAQPPNDDSKVCVSKDKLESVLETLGMSIEDLENTSTESATHEPENTEVSEKPKDTNVSEKPEDTEVSEKPEDTNVSEKPETPEEPTMAEKIYTAGELVKLSPNASDPDGDKITFTYSALLDENGEWQTTLDDAGEYIVSVTASDGKSSVTKQLKLIIESGNSAPVIENVDDVVVEEGETVTLNPSVTDADNDDVTISYSGWMTDSSKETTLDDAGEYVVTIIASDGKTETRKTIKVTVLEKNQAPVLGQLDSVSVVEGETVSLDATATDADGDEVTITYSSPLDNQGTWNTEVGDAGTYLVTITATDGKAQDKKTITIVVQPQNTPPTLQLDDVIVTIQENEDGTFTPQTIELNPVVTDADGDDVNVSYSGFMTTNTKVVDETDEGTHQVTVTADDGTAQVSETINVTVEINHLVTFDFG